MVVIPTLNEAKHIESVLEGLLAEVSSFARMSIVVADGGSSDGTVDLVASMCRRFPAITLIHNGARLQSAAVNLAVAQCSGQENFLIRCDAHAHYPANYCKRLIETMNRVNADAVVVSMDSVGIAPVQRAVAWVSNSLLGTGGSGHRAGQRSGFVDHGHHAAFRMETFRKVGGYEDRFTPNEDAEFDCRQRMMGAKVYLDATIRVQYYPRPNLSALWRQYYKYGSARSRTARRHPHSLRLRQMVVPLHVALCATGAALGAWVPSLLAWPAVYGAVLCVASVYFAVRKRALCGLLTGPAAGVMHAAWGCGFLTALVRPEPRWASTSKAV
ncbi:MAG: glycosyltransferase family 2 protein [Myxococcales bacterium]